MAKGHIEFFLCDAADLEDPVNGVVTQECFNKHPLNRAADDDFNSPVDPNYTGRYYGNCPLFREICRRLPPVFLLLLVARCPEVMHILLI